MHNIEKFLEELKTKLPDVCADRDLVQQLPTLFKSHCTLTRLRAQGKAPPHFTIPPNVYYLRADVIAWLETHYIHQETIQEPFSEAEFEAIYSRLSDLDAKYHNLSNWKPAVDAAIVDLNNRTEK